MKNILFYLCLGLGFFTIIAYILLFCYKCSGRYRIGFIIFEVFSLISKILIMLYSTTYSLKGLKKKLEKDEDNDIKYLINDYYNYYNCKKKYPIILIIQIIYLIIELINMIFILKKSSYTSLPTHIPGNSSIQILEFQKEGKCRFK